MLSRLRNLLNGYSLSALDKPAFPVDEYVDANTLLSSALTQQRDGHLATAEETFRKVLTVSPAHPEATHRLGILLAQRGDYRQAEPLLRSATLLNNTNPACFINLGNVLRDQRRFNEAAKAYRDSLAIDPSADAYCNLGDALQEIDLIDEARQSYRHAIELRASFTDAFYGLARLEYKLGHMEASIHNAELVLSFDPGHSKAHNNIGLALVSLGRIEEAIDHYLLAISRCGENAEAYNNLGNALSDLGYMEKAIAAYETSLRFRPDFAYGQWNYSFALLKIGDFERGWAAYENRFHIDNGKLFLRNFKQPVWKGGDLRGRTILLHAEQGFGDTLQFVRFVSLIAAQGATVYLEVQPPLERLMRNLPGTAAVFPLGAALPPFDMYCSLMSLPYRMNIQLETIPADMPYLFAPAEMVAAWGERIRHDCNLRVGLVWSSNVLNKAIYASKSVPLQDLRVLGECAGVSFYSLQKGEGCKEIATGGMSLIDWSDDLKDFCDTAALIANLDLVISVDTAVAHLAGALGKPVWMLNRLNSDWRWFQEREDSPWYPTMHLFWQDQLGDWTTPIARLRTALDEAAQAFAESGRFVNPPLAATQAVQTPEATDEVAAEAAKNAGNAAYSNGDLEQAEQHYHRAVTLNPDYAEAHNNLALVLRAQQNYLEAEKHLLRAIAAKPDLSNAYFNLGCLFVDTGRTADAAVQFKKTLALDPDNANAHVELANLVGKQGQLDEAEQHLHKALALDAQSPQAYCNLASVFLSRGDTERAIDHARKSVEIDPAFAGGHNVLGAILLESGRLDLATVALRQAIALAPDLKIAQYNLALCLMLMGNYDEGFALYASRDTTPRLAGVSENEHGKLMEIVSSISPWQGEPLEGRRLLIWQEQGFGDLLMMLRYLPLLLEKGVAEITLRCTPIQALARLVAAMPGGDRVQVIDSLATVSPGVDFQCPQMSLPYLFATRPETIPRNIPYLVVPDEIAKSWKARLNSLPGLKVGLVWSGNSNNPSDAQRSIAPTLLAPLLAVAGVSFVSLQKLAKDSPMAIHDDALHNWMNECTDFLDTAALIENLDLVIAVDTAVAHLAGALGKPVWLLNRLNTDWRWFQDREDSPWYPTMRIFRQTRRGEWGAPIERISAALDGIARAFASTGRFINPSLPPT